MAGHLSALAESWRQGLANALGDVPVGADVVRGMVRLWAPLPLCNPMDERKVVEASLSITAGEPDEDTLVMLAEEFHAAGYPRP